MWIVYMLQSAVTGRLYTGITLDLDRRVRQHNTNGQGAKATRAGRPWAVVYTERVLAKGDALRREIAIKALSRTAKLALFNPS